MLRVIVAALWLAVFASGQTGRFDVNALLGLERVAEPRLSPDGLTVAFTATRIDVAANKRLSDIYVIPTGGGVPRQITNTGDNSRPQWAPDSAKIAFLSRRSGSSQVWTMKPDGTQAFQLTDFPTGAEGHLYSPDGRYILFASAIYPSCGADASCNQRMLKQEEESKVKARIYDSLLYRHWNEWRGPRRNHLLQFLFDTGQVRDITPAALESPPFSLGGPDDYAIAPDGKEIVFVANPDPTPATSTNNELYAAPAYPDPSFAAPVKLTLNEGADSSPQFSPDGRHLAWRAQFRAGYESDRWRLIVRERDTGVQRDLTDALDRSVSSFVWSPDSSRLFYTTEDRARQTVSMISVKGGASRIIVQGAGYVDDVQFTPDSKLMVYSETTSSKPTELYKVFSTGGAPEALTRINEDRLRPYDLKPAEDFFVTSFDQAKVHSLMIKPPGFQENRKYPMLLLIHGGPQGAWGHNWSYRWNAQVFANAGFVVVMPNPRGSTGYGTQFTDGINQDWGGKVYDDLMAVMSHVEQFPFVDKQRMSAAGGSFGGYMVNWILGHDSRFKALISHAGVYDLVSMFGETEELWFPLWEFGGPPWERPDIYERLSPSKHVSSFRTPTLVIHGELDYRVSVGQGLQLFTALQMMKVPSKLLLFPDEGHWIQKPQNSILWYRTFLEWIDVWTKVPSPAATQ